MILVNSFGPDDIQNSRTGITGIPKSGGNSSIIRCLHLTVSRGSIRNPWTRGLTFVIRSSFCGHTQSNTGAKKKKATTIGAWYELQYSWQRWVYNLNFAGHIYLYASKSGTRSSIHNGMSWWWPLEWHGILSKTILGPISLSIFPSRFKCDENFILLSPKY